MGWGSGVLDLPNLDGVDDAWTLPDADPTPPRRLRSPALERLRPKLQADLGDDNAVETALDDAETKINQFTGGSVQASLRSRANETLNKDRIGGVTNALRAVSKGPSGVLGQDPSNSDYLDTQALDAYGKVSQKTRIPVVTPALEKLQQAANPDQTQWDESLYGPNPLNSDRLPFSNTTNKIGTGIGQTALSQIPSTGLDLGLTALPVAHPVASAGAARLRAAIEANPELRGNLKNFITAGERGSLTLPDSGSLFHGSRGGVSGLTDEGVQDGLFGKATYLTRDKKAAEFYSRGHEGPAVANPTVLEFADKGLNLLDSKKPIGADLLEKLKGALPENAAKRLIDLGPDATLDRIGPRISNSLPDALQSLGYDGVATGPDVAVFKPSKLKAATQEPLSDLEKLLQQSQEKIQTKGKSGATQDFGANNAENAQRMAEKSKAQGAQYAEATNLSKKAAQMTGENANSVRKRAIAATKKALDALNSELGASDIETATGGLLGKDRRSKGIVPEGPIPPERYFGTDQPPLGKNDPNLEPGVHPEPGPSLGTLQLNRALTENVPTPREPLGGTNTPIEAQTAEQLRSGQPNLPGVPRPIEPVTGNPINVKAGGLENQPNFEGEMQPPIVPPVDIGHGPGVFPAGDNKNAIVESFKTSLAGAAKDMPKSQGISKGVAGKLSRVGGGLGDTYLDQLTTSEKQLKHALIQDATKDLKKIDLSGMTPDQEMTATANQVRKLESIIKSADADVARFRSDSIDKRYGLNERPAVRERLKRNDEVRDKPRGSIETAADATQAKLKGAVLGFDLGAFLQQGLKAARTGTTSALSSGLGHGIHRIGTALGKDSSWLDLYPDKSISEFAQRQADGVIQTGAEAAGIERNAEGINQLTKNSVTRGRVKDINNAMFPESENLGVSVAKAPFRIAGAVNRTAADVQYGALEALRKQIYEGRLYQAKLWGQDISPGSRARAAAAEYANMATSTAHTATDAGRALTERRVMLSAPMTRAQFAEMSNPLKTFRSPADAFNTANQLLSTAAVFGTAYAINDQLGVSDPTHFLTNTANPLSTNFGKIVLKAKDANGNHLVWNFLPQFSTENAVLKSLRATSKLAKGDVNAEQAIHQVGEALGTYGMGRLNQGLSDLSKIGGFGYGKNGQFYWGNMPNEQRALGVAPIPLTAQQSLVQGETSPTSIAANVLGGNVYGESAFSVASRAAQARGYDSFADAPYSVQQQIRQDPDYIKAKAANPSAYDTRKAEVMNPLDQRQSAIDEALKSGTLDRPYKDALHDLNVAKGQARKDIETQFAKEFGLSGKKQTDVQKAVDDYFKIGDNAQTVSGQIDWDKADLEQQKFLESLPDDTRAYVQDMLDTQKLQGSQTVVDRRKYLDRKDKLGYFKDNITAAQRTALDAANPDVDVQNWYYSGYLKNGIPQAGQALQSDAAVRRALAMDLPNRPIKREGITRPINESPKTLQAWQYSKGPTEFYLTAGGQKNLDTFAQDRFGVRYDRLKDTDQTLIRNAVKTEIRKDPELQAWLYFWDGKPIGDVAKLRTVDPDTVDILAQLYKKYGAPK